MAKYGITLEQLAAPEHSAVHAAEREGSRTIVYRGTAAIAAIVSIADAHRHEPPDPGEAGDDPLLSLMGTCAGDEFVDSLRCDLGHTEKIRRSGPPQQSAPPPRPPVDAPPPTKRPPPPPRRGKP